MPRDPSGAVQRELRLVEREREALRERVPPDERVLLAAVFRPVAFRAAVLRPVVFRAAVFLAVDLRAVDFLAVDLRAVDLRAVAFLAVAFFAVDLRAVDFRAVDFRAVDFFAVDFRAVALFAVDLRAVDFRAVDFFAVDFRAVDFLAVDFRAVDLLAVDFRAVDFRAVDFFAVDFRAVDFLAVDFRAVDFLAVDFRAVLFFLAPALLREDPERELELREPERDEDRVVAGTARATSALSSFVTSPIAASPHVSSAATAAVDSLSESTLNGSTVSPIPLQSSWVINDLLPIDCCVHDSLPRWFVTCNADGQLRVHVAGKENARANEPLTRHARARSSGCCVGAATPPLRSSVTITSAPGGTARDSLTRPPLNTPAGCTVGVATHASYVLPFGGDGSETLSTASPEGATTSWPGVPFTAMRRASGSLSTLVAERSVASD
jgi:uncharacterized protein YjbI with pentapeptide repeats